ncbi:hypothetical protein HY450_00995 [Candidatus Pacearchaeota archaeon]|nr:hypothetical protein [Candidatus Pacearchaeota archaeon]
MVKIIDKGDELRKRREKALRLEEIAKETLKEGFDLKNLKRGIGDDFYICDSHNSGRYITVDVVNNRVTINHALLYDKALKLAETYEAKTKENFELEKYYR